MTNSKQHEEIRLTIDVPGMVQIFGDALYQDFGSIVRELVQNGHDAIISTVASESADPEQLRDHKVEIQFDELDMSLLVSDDGSGMSRDELIQQLSRFAQSSKRKMRDELTDARVSEMLQIIGEYGVGFLAAMAVSDSVKLTTLRQGASKAACWQYDAGDEQAHLLELSVTEFRRLLKDHSLSDRTSGTVVDCRLKPNVIEEYEVDEYEIRDSLVRYAALLPIPIH